MRLSLLVVRKYAPIRRCALNREWSLAPPTASTFEHSMTKLASYEHSISWTKLCNSSWEYDRKPSLEENRGKIADFFGAPNLSQWNIEVLSIADLMPLAIRK